MTFSRALKGAKEFTKNDARAKSPKRKNDGKKKKKKKNTLEK